MTSSNIADVNELKRLNDHFRDHLFVTGDHPSHDDNVLLNEFFSAKKEPEAKTYPFLHSWYTLITMYVVGVRDQWTHDHEIKEKGKQKGKQEKAEVKTAPVEEKKVEVKAAAADDDDIDLFAEDAKPAPKKEAPKKEAPKKEGGKPAKPELIPKSLVLLDIKIWEPDNFDYDALAQKIIAIKLNGLMWKTEYKLADLCFGVKKIVIGCVVEDDKVGVDDLTDKIAEEFSEEVQSVDIAAFNKI